MKTVLVVIRAYNRLEYTIRCIQSIIDNTTYPNYKILVVNNNSSDGTKEWLDWITKFSTRYSSLSTLHLNENLGDFGGLVKGVESVDSDYVIKLDNDCEVPIGWMSSLVYVLENSGFESVMLKRVGVERHITLNHIRSVGTYKVASVTRNVCCWIMDSSRLKEVMYSVDRDRDLGLKANIKCGKIINSIAVKHIDGYQLNTDSYPQIMKYPKCESIWEKFS